MLRKLLPASTAALMVSKACWSGVPVFGVAPAHTHAAEGDAADLEVFGGAAEGDHWDGGHDCGCQMREDDGRGKTVGESAAEVTANDVILMRFISDEVSPSSFFLRATRRSSA